MGKSCKGDFCWYICSSDTHIYMLTHPETEPIITSLETTVEVEINSLISLHLSLHPTWPPGQKQLYTCSTYFQMFSLLCILVYSSQFLLYSFLIAFIFFLYLDNAILYRLFLLYHTIYEAIVFYNSFSHLTLLCKCLQIFAIFSPGSSPYLSILCLFLRTLRWRCSQ